jgi:hypothetical protein
MSPRAGRLDIHNEPDVDSITELAEIIEPMIQKHPEVLQRGLTHLRNLTQMQVEIGELDPNEVAVPTEERHSRSS